ncbi:MAG: hypothetical protein ACTSQE_11890 [Candidatus Heimdallarchaeaceae archaeon]
MTILENLFHISSHMFKENMDMQTHEIRRDPWTTEYLPELYVTSDKMNGNVAQVASCAGKGNCFCTIIGDIKSGKSYLMNLLKEGFKESLLKYTSFNRLYIELITPDVIGSYSLSKYMQILAQTVLGKYYASKEQIIVQLKKHIVETNSLLIVFIDNFVGEELEKIVCDTAKLLKLLKDHFSSILSCHGADFEKCSDILEEKVDRTVTYSFRIPDFSLDEARKMLSLRMKYAFGKSNININSIYEPIVIEKAWVYSGGNPWILLSLLSDSYNYAQSVKAKKVTEAHFEKVYRLFSRTKIVGEKEDLDRFFIQQALNEFPNRERQVCEYLLYRDATARDITLHLYGELPPNEYRTKYMGTKSFIRRLRGKNIVVITGKSGRSLLFGLNPRLKDFLSESRNQ